MSGNPLSSPNGPFYQTPLPASRPEQVAATVGNYVRAMITLIFWLVAGVAALAVAYVSLRVIWSTGERLLHLLTV